MPFNFETWDGFETPPKQDLDYLINTTDINARLEKLTHSPYRVKVGAFQVDRVGVKRAEFDSIVQERSARFVDVMQKKGWELCSKLSLTGPFIARDLESKFVMLDRNEFRVRGIFKYPKSLERVRIELPAGIVRQDPDQVIDHKQAAKAG